MDALSSESMRRRLQLAFAEPPAVNAFAAVCVIWRFPHLETLNRSWTLLSARNSTDGLLRIAEGERFSDSQEIRIRDVSLSPDDLLGSFDLLTRLEIVGDQRGGIYDGPAFGLAWFDEHSGEVTEISTWIRDDTL